jgi:NADP+-dependent farnesol dehydrogenase
MDRWVNKVALVTGASSGIGRAIAEQLVHHGVKVVGIDHRVEKMKVLADEWKSKMGKLIPLQCDLTNEGEIVRTMEWIEKNLGVVEMLINNAAIDLPTTLMTEGGMEEWRKTLDVNVLGVVVMIKEMLKMLKRKGLNSGVIININDICAWQMMKRDRPVSTSYLVTKNALRTITDNLRLELAQMHSNVKVISIIPGLVETEMTEHTLKEKPRLALKPKDVADAVLMTIQTPDTVLIQDLVITPIRDVMTCMH